jgi:CDP-2,3-bis-(O-geranylgeranyl)-sn-glycerol synthase
VVDAWLLVPAGVLWVLLPAYAANATATLPKGRGPPMDFGRTWPRDGARVLGTSKTWSGFIFGSLFPLWIGLLEEYLWLIAPPSWRYVPALASSMVAAIPVILLLTMGALTGDVIGSFAKRRLAIPSGGRFFPWDQILFVLVPVGLGFILDPSLFVPTFGSWPALFWTAVFTIGLHVGFNYIGYWTGLKKVPW